MLYYIIVWSALILVGLLIKGYIDEVRLNEWIKGFEEGMSAMEQIDDQREEVQKELER